MEVKLDNSSKEQINQEQPSVNFWENCGQKTKTEIMDLLAEKLGKPKNNLDINCLDALARKILYFYGEVKDNRSQAIHSLTGQVVEIAQTTFKEGKRGGEIYYSLKLANKTILRAIKADLSIEKWTQVEQLTILDQNLLFKYRTSIFGKDICDFCPVGTEPTSQTQSNVGGGKAPEPDGKNQVN